MTTTGSCVLASVIAKVNKGSMVRDNVGTFIKDKLTTLPFLLPNYIGSGLGGVGLSTAEEWCIYHNHGWRMYHKHEFALKVDWLSVCIIFSVIVNLTLKITISYCFLF